MPNPVYVPQGSHMVVDNQVSAPPLLGGQPAQVIPGQDFHQVQVIVDQVMQHLSDPYIRNHIQSGWILLHIQEALRCLILASSPVKMSNHRLSMLADLSHYAVISC